MVVVKGEEAAAAGGAGEEGLVKAGLLLAERVAAAPLAMLKLEDDRIIVGGERLQKEPEGRLLEW
jgi:hypothetical protein